MDNKALYNFIGGLNYAGEHQGELPNKQDYQKVGRNQLHQYYARREQLQQQRYAEFKKKQRCEENNLHRKYLEKECNRKKIRHHYLLEEQFQEAELCKRPQHVEFDRANKRYVGHSKFTEGNTLHQHLQKQLNKTQQFKQYTEQQEAVDEQQHQSYLEEIFEHNRRHELYLQSHQQHRLKYEQLKKQLQLEHNKVHQTCPSDLHHKEYERSLMHCLYLEKQQLQQKQCEELRALLKEQNDRIRQHRLDDLAQRNKLYKLYMNRTPFERK